MQLRSQAETQTQMLKRMIVMLLNIAGLAERCASYPAAARVLVLFILHRAEAYAYDYFTDIFEQHPESFGFYSGTSPEDALELADSFRKLAAAIQQALFQDRIFQSWWAGDDDNGCKRSTERGLTLTNFSARREQDLAARTGLERFLRRLADPAPIPRLDSS